MAREKPGLTPEERAALTEAEVLRTLEAFPEPDRTLALRLHTLIQHWAPGLSPRLWYGMPAYAWKGKVLCFFQPAHKFKTRYATLGFTDLAQLDEGTFWPVAFAVKALGQEEEEKVRQLLRKALGEGLEEA
ncbi:DUF1801 domain-containing protein [Thermus sp. SYSU G05001]|uniref:DUF1801 domain-containing protein n=1 Tax=Thermus brevis TaxID=2862456 RepID=A0ABS7A0I3_9DEIN|nr:DUF1801 domain-containing protein [Thermus brevis]